MILDKKNYSRRFRITTYFKVLSAGFIFFINRHIFHRPDITIPMRPKLLPRSKIIIGDWKSCEMICPTDSLFIEQKDGKLKNMTLDLSRCTGCGDCLDVAPENSIELVPSHSINLLKNEKSKIELLSEL